MSEKASEKKVSMRKSTRFPGVQMRESMVRKHNGKKDVVFTIDYIDPQSNKRVRKDIGWASEGFSAAYAAQVRADILLKGKLANPAFKALAKKKFFTLEQAFEKFIQEWLIPRKSVIKSDKSIFKKLEKYKHTNINEIDVRFVDTVIADLASQNYSNQTIQHVVKLLQRIINKMDDWGLYHGEKPFAKVKLPKLNNRRMRFLTPDEAKALLAILKEQSLPMYMQALISLHCGLRFGEICNLKVTDIDFFSKNIFISNPKNHKSRHQVMTTTVEKELRLFIDMTKPTEYIFPTKTGRKAQFIGKAFANAVKQLGLNIENGVEIKDNRQRVVFHTLRHTYASWLALSGQGQAMIAELMGHSSIEMSARYTHLFPDARKATATAIDDLFLHKKS